MYKNSCFIIFIILIILSGCSDTSVGGSSYDKDVIEIMTLTKGDMIHNGSAIEIDYTVNEQDVTLNKLVITVFNSEGNIVKEVIIEEEPLSQWVPDVEFDQELPVGLYILRMEFYDGEEPYYNDEREFFITDANYYIKSVTSYPPVLYPGAGGLFFADIECPEMDCWMRWSLDGVEIASGMRLEGYQSIRIDAPENEGVYELNLEVFPLPPEDGDGYDYDSTVLKSIPVYVNTSQKTGINEFGPDEDFYSLFHFRGSLINSSNSEPSSVESFIPIGNPLLSVRNGVFGYSLDNNSGFESERMILPVEDGKLQSFSLMFSVIPGNLTGSQPEDQKGGVFYSGSTDGRFYLAVDVLTDGQLRAELGIGGEQYQLYSGVKLLTADTYTSLSLSVHPDDEQLSISWYKDGVPAAEKKFYMETELSGSLWQSVDLAGHAFTTRFAGIGGFEGLVDELGVYSLQSDDGAAVDPEQYSRSMELEYGKFLMYAEGFDGESDALFLHEESAAINESTLVIKPGGHVDFPPIFPGYEEIVFTLTLADSSTRDFEIVFNPDGQDDEIVRVDLLSETEDLQPIIFSLIFSSDTVIVGETEEQDGETGFAGDFGGIVYRLINVDEAFDLEIESVTVIRKSINVSNAGLKDDGFARKDEPDIAAGVNVSS